MAKNHEIIIGLGGTGGRAIQAFKRVVHRRKAEAAELQEMAQISYLYLDSNDDVLHSSAGELFLPSEYILLEKDHLKLNEISQLRHIAPWLGNMAEHLSETTLSCLCGSGQLRRVGRLLFACHVQRIKAHLRAMLGDMINGSNPDIRFRLFCSLGGGTGSGCLIDMITLIHSLIEEMNIRGEIYVYPFVSGDTGMLNAGAFYENEYATLRDLNALMVGCYHPHMLAEADNSFYQNFPPVRQVFLSSEMAPGAPRLSEQLEHMAEACFDSIVYTCGTFEGTNCLKAFTGEDLLDVFPGEPDDGNPLRSYRFATLSRSNWALPAQGDQSVMEYLAQEAGADSALWEERIGRYAEELMETVARAGVELDTHEPGLQQPQVSPLTAVLIGMPATRQDAFSRWLAQRLEKAAQRCLLVLRGRWDIYRSTDTEDIRVLAVQYWFPARFYPIVAFLHKKYQATAADDAKARVLYFANIDDAGIPLESPERPSLMV